VAVASVGGWIALRQLRDQQDVIGRQTIQPERQQAEQIGFYWESAKQINEVIDDPIWMGVVRNNSRRPIRDVICRIQPGPGQGFDLEAQGVAESSMWARGRMRALASSLGGCRVSGLSSVRGCGLRSRLQ
jgi:hypothetical protein